MKTISIIAIIFVLAVSSASAQSTFGGNGNSGFGGPIGQGSLTLNDNGTTLTGTVNKGPNGFNDVLVIYIDSVTGGFSSTGGFTDAGDGLRRAISGFDGGANRSTLNFISGFNADYAIALGPQSDNFGGLFTLSSGGSFGYDGSVALTPTGTSGSSTYSFSLSLASIGITAGQSFNLFGTYISNTGYRADEAVAGNAAGAQGYNTFTQTSFATYTTVPEPSTFALAGMSLLITSVLVRRRR